MGGDGRGDVCPLMTIADAAGAREYVVPCKVMAGEPGTRVCEEMIKKGAAGPETETELAVTTWVPLPLVVETMGAVD